MKRIYALLAITALYAVSLASPLAADTRSSREGWSLRLHGVQVSSSGEDQVTSPTGTEVFYSVDSGSGFALSGEYRFHRRFGVDVGLVLADVDVEGRLDFTNGASETSRGGSDFQPIHLGLNFHLLPEGRMDLWAGISGAFAGYGDARLPTATVPRFHYDAEDRVVAGAQVGLDVYFGDSGWGLSAVGRYFDAPMVEEDPNGALAAAGLRGDIDTSPWVVGVGVVKTFARRGGR